MPPRLAILSAALLLLAACGRVEPRIDTPSTSLGSPAGGRMMDRPMRDVGAVPMPSGIACDRNAAGYAESCTDR